MQDPCLVALTPHWPLPMGAWIAQDEMAIEARKNRGQGYLHWQWAIDKALDYGLD